MLWHHHVSSSSLTSWSSCLSFSQHLHHLHLCFYVFLSFSEVFHSQCPLVSLDSLSSFSYLQISCLWACHTFPWALSLSAAWPQCIIFKGISPNDWSNDTCPPPSPGHQRVETNINFGAGDIRLDKLHLRLPKFLLVEVQTNRQRQTQTAKHLRSCRQASCRTSVYLTITRELRAEHTQDFVTARVLLLLQQFIIWKLKLVSLRFDIFCKPWSSHYERWTVTWAMAVAHKLHASLLKHFAIGQGTEWPDQHHNQSAFP